MAIIIYFGLPGAGKTTYAARIVYRNLRKGVKTYSNVPIVGSVQYSEKLLGTVVPYAGDLILDEAGVAFNSRRFKQMPDKVIEFFKKYRQAFIGDIHVFSQGADDMDKIIRNLADSAYYIRKSLFGLSTLKRLKLDFDLDETHQPTIFWRWAHGIPMFFYRPKYYKMFNSWNYQIDKQKERLYLIGELGDVTLGRETARKALSGGEKSGSADS